MSSSKSSFNLVEQSVSTLAESQGFIKSVMDLTSKVALEFAKTDNDENSDSVKSTKEIMRSFCQMDIDVEQFLAAANDVMTQFQDSENVDLVATFEEKLAEMKRRAAKQTAESHAKYAEMENLIEDAIDQGDDADESIARPQVVDDDLVMTQATANTRCPYTGQEMVNPVTNKRCGHSYDCEGIKEFIRHKGKKARCPVSGCINEKPLELEDLEENKRLKKLIKRNKNLANNSDK